MSYFDDSEKIALLRLDSIPGIGGTRTRNLIARFKNPSAVFQASFAELTKVEGIDKRLALNILNKKTDVRYAQDQFNKARKLGVKIVTYWDREYPENLKKTADPPAILHVLGEVVPQDTIALAVVGTRMPSDYGKVVTEKLTVQLVRKGFTIVSGLARGIDTIAHRVTLNSCGRTIAVLGSGIDMIYPAENKKLAAQIIQHGAIVSEFPFGTLPDATNFPRRNRIISGLSLGTLVVEAGQKSGALITAEIALEQGREVFAIPGSILSNKSVGTNRLIKEGAKLVQTIDDIIIELEPKLRGFCDEARQMPSVPAELSEIEKRMLKLLSEKPVHIDTIAQTLGISTAEALSVLLTLELKEFVKQLSGKMFVRMI